MQHIPTNYKFKERCRTDEDTLIKITTVEPLKEILKIKEKYIMAYWRVLIEDLESDLSGNFQKVMVTLFTHRFEYDEK